MYIPRITKWNNPLQAHTISRIVCFWHSLCGLCCLIHVFVEWNEIIGILKDRIERVKFCF